MKNAQLARRKSRQLRCTGRSQRPILRGGFAVRA